MIYVVTCLFDHKVRHRAPFDTLEEAAAWAEWGHTCTAEHGIEEFPEAGSGEGADC